MPPASEAGSRASSRRVRAERSVRTQPTPANGASAGQLREHTSTGRSGATLVQLARDGGADGRVGAP